MTWYWVVVLLAGWITVGFAVAQLFTLWRDGEI